MGTEATDHSHQPSEEEIDSLRRNIKRNKDERDDPNSDEEIPNAADTQ